MTGLATNTIAFYNAAKYPQIARKNPHALFVQIDHEDLDCAPDYTGIGFDAALGILSDMQNYLREKRLNDIETHPSDFEVSMIDVKTSGFVNNFVSERRAAAETNERVATGLMLIKAMSEKFEGDPSNISQAYKSLAILGFTDADADELETSLMAASHPYISKFFEYRSHFMQEELQSAMNNNNPQPA